MKIRLLDKKTRLKTLHRVEILTKHTQKLHLEIFECLISHLDENYMLLIIVVHSLRQILGDVVAIRKPSDAHIPS